MNDKKRNAAIFEDTRNLCKNNSILGMIISHSNTFQTVYMKTTPQHLLAPRFTEPADVIVSKKRSFEAAEAYRGKGVCVLNSASATNPGGGVKWGASSQEESLCRCSTLFENISTKDCWASFYGPHQKANNPLGNDDIIYTPEVMVFKTDTDIPVLREQDEWFTCSVITCAAPDLRPDRNTGRRVRISNERLKELLSQRIHNILSVAAGNENDVMILGAFGCGAFRNPPEVVAAAMKEAVDFYKFCFRTIEIAMCCDPRSEKNYEVFNRILSSENNT